MSAGTDFSPLPPRSVWASTARVHAPFSCLDGDLKVEVAIVGAGFTGLAAAHHLARAGVECAVIDAQEPGWGASGRNGGMAVTRYKPAWAALAQRYGEETARRLHGMLFQALDLVEETVADRGIECGFGRYGHVTAVNGRAATIMLERDIAWLAAAGDHTPSMLCMEETAERTGTTCYIGGYFDPRAAGMHPLDYSLGLAAALRDAGVPVFGRTAAAAIREDASGATIETHGGTIRAARVILATNAYTELFSIGGDLQRRIVPVSTSVITTVPLPDALLATLAPHGHLVSDTRHLLNYFRIAPGNRMLFGGRGSLTGRESPEVYRGLERKLVETFPSLEGAAIDHRWSGKVAVTLDDLPHIGCIGERVAFAMGYGGRGVALAALLGQRLAQWATGKGIEAGPMSANRFAPIPLHALRIPGMKAVATYYRILDALHL